MGVFRLFVPLVFVPLVLVVAKVYTKDMEAHARDHAHLDGDERQIGWGTQITEKITLSSSLADERWGELKDRGVADLGVQTPSLPDESPTRKKEKNHPCTFYERYHNLLYQKRTSHQMKHRIMKAKKVCGTNSNAAWTYNKWKHKWPGGEGEDNDLYCLNRCCVGQIHEIVRSAFSTSAVAAAQWHYEHPLMRFLPTVMGTKMTGKSEDKAYAGHVHGYCKDNSAKFSELPMGMSNYQISEKDASGGVHDICMQYIASEKCKLNPDTRECQKTASARDNVETLFTQKEFMVRLCFCWIPCYYWDKTAAQKKLAGVVKQLHNIAPNKFETSDLHAMYPDMESFSPTMNPTVSPTIFARKQYDPDLTPTTPYPEELVVANEHACRRTSGHISFKKKTLGAKIGDKMKVEVLVHVSKKPIDATVLRKVDAHLIDLFGDDEVAGTFRKELNITLGDGSSASFIDRALLGMCAGQEKTIVVPPKMGQIPLKKWLTGEMLTHPLHYQKATVWQHKDTIVIPYIPDDATLLVAVIVKSFDTAKHWFEKSSSSTLPPTPRATMKAHYENVQKINGNTNGGAPGSPTPMPTLMAWPNSITAKPTTAPTHPGVDWSMLSASGHCPAPYRTVDTVEDCRKAARFSALNVHDIFAPTMSARATLPYGCFVSDMVDGDDPSTVLPRVAESDDLNPPFVGKALTGKRVFFNAHGSRFAHTDSMIFEFDVVCQLGVGMSDTVCDPPHVKIDSHGDCWQAAKLLGLKHEAAEPHYVGSEAESFRPSGCFYNTDALEVYFNPTEGNGPAGKKDSVLLCQLRGSPTFAPTGYTAAPSSMPSHTPTTQAPTMPPSTSPTSSPTKTAPSTAPSAAPTALPTASPSHTSATPTAMPTAIPSFPPTRVPTSLPTVAPTPSEQGPNGVFGSPKFKQSLEQLEKKFDTANFDHMPTPLPTYVAPTPLPTSAPSTSAQVMSKSSSTLYHALNGGVTDDDAVDDDKDRR